VSETALYRSFDEMGVPSSLVSRLGALGISTPSLIQQRVIPFLQKYSHTGVLVHAPTGTGKSLAFLLPVLTKLLEQRAELSKRGGRNRSIQAVIVCPTQELALQTHAQLHALIYPPGSPPPPPLGVGAESYVALCVGGFQDVEVQREHLLRHTPAIVVGTPKRLNSIFFPLYETHGDWRQKRKSDEAIKRAVAEGQIDSAQVPSRLRPREVIYDPPEDEESFTIPRVDRNGVPEGAPGFLDPEDWPVEARDEFDEDDDEDDEIDFEPGKGESHKPLHDYAANRRERQAAARREFEERNNVARAAGDPRGAEADRDDELEPGEEPDDPELDGVDDLFMPARHNVGWEGQKLLRLPTTLARAQVHSPLRKIFREVQYLVIDEADEVLKPLSKYSSDRAKKNRTVHPKPSNIFVRGLTLLNPTVQLVAASATINQRFRRLLHRLGFNRPRPVHIRINARGTGEAEAQMVAAAMQQAQQKANTELLASTTPGPDALGNLVHNPATALASPFASSVNAWTSPGRALDMPLSRALQYHLECPPNLKHLYVLAPSFNAWRLGKHHEQASYPRKVAYDANASDEARQAVHEHNLLVSQQLRRNAALMDKLATLAVLLQHFRPRCAVLVVDEERGHKLGAVLDSLLALGVRATLLYHHLSSADLTARARFFRDVSAGAFDVLIVGASSVRGLDLPMCDLVVSLSCAREPADYLHMAGRTGRMGREGSVLTLLHPEELAQLDVLTGFMPETLRDAQQLLPPRNVPPSLLKRILDEYERTRPQREKERDAMMRAIDQKLKKRVPPKKND